MKYTGKKNRELRAKGHHLKPVVVIGSVLTKTLLERINEELNAHSLIKVRLGKGVSNRKQLAVVIAEKTGAHVAQMIGRVLLLYLPPKEEDVR